MAYYTANQAIIEANDASDLDNPTSARYNWKALLPPDVYDEVNELFKDEKPPFEFSNHSVFSNQGRGNHPINPYTASHESDPAGAKYGDMYVASASGPEGLGFSSGNSGTGLWSGFDSTDHDSWSSNYVNEGGEGSLINMTNNMERFGEGDTLEDYENWMIDSLPPHGAPTPQVGSEFDWLNIDDAGGPDLHYNNGNRMYPYSAMQYHAGGPSAYHRYYLSNEQAINSNMEDTFGTGGIYGVGTSQDLLSVTDLFNPQSVANALTEVGDLGTALNHAPALNNTMIRNLRGSSYRPLLNSARGTLYDTFRKGVSEANMKGKGFAAYGGRNLANDNLVNTYNKEIRGAMNTISSKRGEARGEVGDILNTWRNLSEQA